MKNDRRRKARKYLYSQSKIVEVSNISTNSVNQLGVDKTVMDLLLFDNRIIDPETLFVTNQFKQKEVETINQIEENKNKTQFKNGKNDCE